MTTILLALPIWVSLRISFKGLSKYLHRYPNEVVPYLMERVMDDPNFPPKANAASFAEGKEAMSFPSREHWTTFIERPAIIGYLPSTKEGPELLCPRPSNGLLVKA